MSPYCLSFRNFGSWTLFLVILFSWTRSATSLSLIPRNAAPAKPACDPREPCRVAFLGLEFCSCANNRNCPLNPDTTLTYENIDYHFCQPTTVHSCRDGEVAWVRRGLRQIIHCKCPPPLQLSSEVWDTITDTTEYKCSQSLLQQRQCTDDDVCMVRNRVLLTDRTASLLKGLCQCPLGKQCSETGQTIGNRSSTDLEQDIFKCRPVIVDAVPRADNEMGEWDEYEEMK